MIIEEYLITFLKILFQSQWIACAKLRWSYVCNLFIVGFQTHQTYSFLEILSLNLMLKAFGITVNNMAY